MHTCNVTLHHFHGNATSHARSLQHAKGCLKLHACPPQRGKPERVTMRERNKMTRMMMLIATMNMMKMKSKILKLGDQTLQCLHPKQRKRQRQKLHPRKRGRRQRPNLPTKKTKENEQETKELLKRKSKAYHRGKAAALKNGESEEAAKAAARKATEHIHVDAHMHAQTTRIM